MSKLPDKLPDKLSDLIDLAVADCVKVEADPRYELEMSRWHEPSGDVCKVCMAGAVLAKTFAFEPDTWNPFELLSGADDRKLDAVNCARKGYVRDALSYIQIIAVGDEQRFAVDTAGDLIKVDPLQNACDRASWATYTEAARILREAGL